ncbi:MAG: hypothetical protein LBU61_01515, partial [Coriobacteriales bacterium]|nr:hypothetical protein [Coriobacteriales bacterium]
FKQGERIPTSGKFWTWKYLDAGYSLHEALYDYEILEKVNSEFHEIYQYDAYMDIGTRNPMRLPAALGGGLHYIDDSGEALLIDDNTTLYREEYMEYLTRTAEFQWSKQLKRMARPGVTIGELRNAVLEFMAFGEYAGKMSDKLLNYYGAMMTINPATIAFIPIETFFIGLRGMRELALDVAKHKDLMKEVSDMMFEQQIAPMLGNAPNVDQNGFVGHLGSVFFAHSMLNQKQFEELHWPYFKKIIDTAVANNLRIFVFCESAMLRFAEFFEDIPKGILMIHPEQDDIFEFRRRLPNIVLSGGMPTSLLGYASPKECVDYARRLVEELGPGFVLSQDKMMSYRCDATRENLLAVNEFAADYR